MRRFSIGCFFALLIAVAPRAFAAFDDSFLLNKTSFTATNDTTKLIPNTPPGTVMWGVIVSSPSNTGSVTIYDSSGSATKTIGVIGFNGIAGSQYIPFEVMLSSGLTYTTVGNTVGVTIIYKRTRP